MKHKLWAFWWLAPGILIIALGAVLTPAGTAGPVRPGSARLFGTLELRTSLKVLPRWEQIKAQAAVQVARLKAGTMAAQPRPIVQWRQMLAGAQDKDTMEKLETVNRFFNRWPYRLDREVYGESDHWATPEEFMIHSGDCEDYGIAKYFSLRQLGFTAQQLRLVVVQDRIRGIGHAVLAVYLDEAVYILDNLTDQVLPHTRYRHYRPQYSVNEFHGWAHLPVKAEDAFSDGRVPGGDPLGKDP
jgi:predicted transglutaminase-like cysteine proteinase